MLNGQPTKLIGTFADLGEGRIAATGATLSEIGIRAPEGTQPDALLPLDQFDGVTYVYDEARQSIDVAIGDDGRIAKEYDARAALKGALTPQAGTGLVVNYGLLGSVSEDFEEEVIAFSGVSLGLDTRLYSPYGTVSALGVVAAASGDEIESQRLDTTYRYSDADGLRTYSAGDVISGGLGWTRPIRMGGAQLQSDFALRPDLVTMPLPKFSGSAAVPSTVDVYVNNTKAYSQDVAAGPFEISNLPVLSGSGEARIVIRDAAGREQTVEQSFFASPELLREGLYDYSLEAGVARGDYGEGSFEYGSAPLGSATLRYGFSDALTLEGHLEVADGFVNAGGGVVTELGHSALVSTAAAFSSSESGQGALLYGSLEATPFDIGVRLSSLRTFADYADLASVADEAAIDEGLSATKRLERIRSIKPPRAIDQVSLSLPVLFDDSRISLSLAHIDRVDDDDSLLVSASYSRQLFERVSLFASAFNDFEPDGGLGLFAGLSMPLGDDGSMSAGAGHDRDGYAMHASYAKSLGSEPGSLGWRVDVAEGEVASQQAAVSYRASKALVEARVIRRDDGINGSALIEGAIVAAGGSVFLSNRVDDAFAVVDAGAPDVEVTLENRYAATTGDDGKALVTGLRSYEKNRIAIDPTNLPLNADIPTYKTEVVPAFRAGVPVEFGVSVAQNAALVVLRYPDGSVVPPGSDLSLESSGEQFTVGYDGQAYVMGLAATNRVTVTTAKGTCTAEFAFAAVADEQVTIDPVVCQ